METLVMMYVYYDKAGNIKSISPMPNDLFADKFSTATLPLDEVAMFLTGKRNPFDFIIKEIQRGVSTSFKLVRKEQQILLTRSLDNYLTVVDIKSKSPIIGITVQPYDNKIVIKLNAAFKELAADGTDEEQESVSDFVKQSYSTLYFTKENNPYHLLHTVTFLPEELFNRDTLYFDYSETIDLSSSSVYTKKIINSYGFKVRT